MAKWWTYNCQKKGPSFFSNHGGQSITWLKSGLQKGCTDGGRKGQQSEAGIDLVDELRTRPLQLTWELQPLQDQTVRHFKTAGLPHITEVTEKEQCPRPGYREWTDALTLPGSDLKQGDGEMLPTLVAPATGQLTSVRGLQLVLSTRSLNNTLTASLPIPDRSVTKGWADGTAGTNPSPSTLLKTHPQWPERNTTWEAMFYNATSNF